MTNGPLPAAVLSTLCQTLSKDNEQECIPVGCVRPASMVFSTGGICPGESTQGWGRGGVCPGLGEGRCLPWAGGVYPGLGGVCPGLGVSVQGWGICLGGCLSGMSAWRGVHPLYPEADTHPWTLRETPPNPEADTPCEQNDRLV